MDFFQEKVFWKEEEVCEKVEDGRRKEEKIELKKKAADKRKYFHYNNDSHWKRNCPTYLATLKKKEVGPSGGMLVIESNLMVSSASSMAYMRLPIVEA